MNIRIFAFSAVLALWLLHPLSSSAASPPKIPGKIYVKTPDGCGQLYDASVTSETLAYKSNSYWIGDCKHGLYHGFGYWLNPAMTFTPIQTAYMQFGDMQFGTRAEIKPKAGVTELGLGATVGVTLHHESGAGFDQATIPVGWKLEEPLIPFYPTSDGSSLDEFSFSYTELRGAQSEKRTGFTVRIDARSCMLAEKKISGCKALYGDFDIYGVELVTELETGKKESFTLCPNPKTTVGCDALWREIAGPYIEKIVGFVKKTEAVMVAEREALAKASGPAEAALPANWKQYWAANPIDHSAVSMAMKCREISDFYPSSLTNAFYIKQKYSTAPCNSAITAAYAVAQADIFITVDSKSKNQEAALREAYAQAKARRDADNAAAWNGFFNTANAILTASIQIQQQKIDNANAKLAAINQQQQQQYSTAYQSYSQPSSSSAGQQTYAADKVKTGPIHRPELDAKACVKLVELASSDSSLSGGSRVFSNQCGQTVEVFWCTLEECERGSGNTWSLGAGRSWPAPKIEVRYGACLGANSGGMVKNSSGKYDGGSYACTGP